MIWLGRNQTKLKERRNEWYSPTEKFTRNVKLCEQIRNSTGDKKTTAAIVSVAAAAATATVVAEKVNRKIVSVCLCAHCWNLNLFNKMRWENVEDHRPEFSPREISLSSFSVPFRVDALSSSTPSSGRLLFGSLCFFFICSLKSINSIYFQFSTNWHWRHNRTTTSMCWQLVDVCSRVCMFDCVGLVVGRFVASNITGRQHTVTVTVFSPYISYRFFE